MTNTSKVEKRSATMIALAAVFLGGAAFAVVNVSSEASDDGNIPSGSAMTALDDCEDRGDLDDLDGLTGPTRSAWLAALDAAEADDVEMSLTSGYRTCDYQQGLFEEKVDEYGSVEEASVWALPPDESNHVKGIAIDVGPGPAADWLEANGVQFGLCRTMSWEWWHFEFNQEWADKGSCPEPAPEP